MEQTLNMDYRLIDRRPALRQMGTCAVLAVLDAMGLVEEDRPFVHESIIGTTFSARVSSRTTVGERDAIVPVLTGDAWITGEHTCLVDKDRSADRTVDRGWGSQF